MRRGVRGPAIQQAQPQSVPPKTTADFAQPKKAKKHRAPTVSKSARERYARELAEIREAGTLDDALRNGGIDPGHVVAMYADLHEQIYGVAPAELDDGKTFAMARQAAKRMLEKHFEGMRRPMIEFVLWVWEREKSREEWRRGGMKPGGRIGWRLQFGGALVSDYRLDLARRSSNGRPKT